MQRLFLTQAGNGIVQFFRRQAAFCRFPANIDLQQDILPIPKSLNPERMAQNADIFDFNLTQEECLRITGLGETGRTGPDPDNIDF